MDCQERKSMTIVDKMLGRKEYLVSLEGMYCNNCIKRVHDNAAKLHGVKARRVGIDQAIFILKPKDLHKLTKSNIGYEVVDVMEV